MAFSSCEALNDGTLFEPTFHHEADRFDRGGIEGAASAFVAPARHHLMRNDVQLEFSDAWARDAFRNLEWVAYDEGPMSRPGKCR